MLSEELKQLIDASLTDGVLTEKEREVIHKRALLEGLDPDEIDLLLDSEIQKRRQTQEDAAPKIQKCPHCGSIIPAMVTVCPTCGCEITGAESNRLVENFAKGVQKGGVDYVNTFVIPNNAEDLYELMVFLSNAAKSEESSAQMKESLTRKFNECSDKVKILFPDDARFQKVLSSTKINFWQKLTKEAKKQIIIKTIIVLVCIPIVFSIFKCACDDPYSDREEQKEKIEDKISDNNLQDAASMLRKVDESDKRSFVSVYQHLINAYIAAGDVNSAIRVVNDFGRPSNMFSYDGDPTEIRNAYKAFYQPIHDYYISKDDLANAVKYDPDNVDSMFPMPVKEVEPIKDDYSTSEPTTETTPTETTPTENTSTSDADESETSDVSSEDEGTTKKEGKFKKLREKAVNATKKAYQKVKDKLEE